MLLRSWFQGKKCAPYLSPFDVTLQKGDNDINVVQPDLLVICDPESRNEKDKYTGIPLLVVEVLSESSACMDLISKLDLYMSSGVQEYWIVNLLNKEVMVYFFRENDIRKMKVSVKEDIVRSFVFEGLSLEMREIFA